MEPTFKIGDVIDTAWGSRRKIVDIVLGKRVVYGKWVGNGKLECRNEYVLFNITDETLTKVRIDLQDKFTLVSSEQKNEVSSCPNCKGELVEKYSEYVGGNIKKCKSCGWC